MYKKGTRLIISFFFLFYIPGDNEIKGDLRTSMAVAIAAIHQNSAVSVYGQPNIYYPACWLVAEAFFKIAETTSITAPAA